MSSVVVIVRAGRERKRMKQTEQKKQLLDGRTELIAKPLADGSSWPLSHFFSLAGWAISVKVNSP